MALFKVQKVCFLCLDF